jgi:hypothetical protein
MQKSLDPLKGPLFSGPSDSGPECGFSTSADSIFGDTETPKISVPGICTRKLLARISRRI